MQAQNTFLEIVEKSQEEEGFLMKSELKNNIELAQQAFKKAYKE